MSTYESKPGDVPVVDDLEKQFGCASMIILVTLPTFIFLYLSFKILSVI